jgi:hypothetical protein
MTDIRELLRAATDDLVVDTPDPVGETSRAATRHRRTWAATVAVIAAVAAAVVIPLSVTGGHGSTQPVAPSPKPTRERAVIQTWEPDDVEAAAGFGSIWGLSAAGNGNPGRSWVDQLNPATGARIHRFSIPAPTTQIGVGAGRVWVIGQNAGGGGTSYITAIDPNNDRVKSLRLTNPLAEPYDIAFADGSAWVTMQLLNQVWRLTPTVTAGTSDGIAKGTIDVSGGPTRIATTGNGAIWVQRETGNRLTHIVPTIKAGRLTQSVVWKQPIFSGLAPSELLSATDAGGISAINPRTVQVCVGNCFDVPIAPPDVLAAVQTNRGVFYSNTRRTYFVSNRELGRGGNRPTASVPYDEGGSVAPDGNGVVIGAGDAGLIHWIPAG